MKGNIITIGIATAALVGSGAVGALAASQITGPQIATDSVGHRIIKFDTIHKSDLTAKARGAFLSDSDVLANGAVYRTAHYDNGGGGIATVACADDDAASQQYVAISGGAYSIRSTDPINTATQPITSSFAGRMDWSTNTPKPGRLDGWIVNFGPGDAPDATHGTLEVYALCVKVASLDKQVNHY